MLSLLLALACDSEREPNDTSGNLPMEGGTVLQPMGMDASQVMQPMGPVFTQRTEMEPNGADPIEQVNAVAVNWEVSGTISTAGDQDVFQLPTPAGRIYRIELEVPQGSLLDGHLTVFDDGRNEKTPGEGYLKIMSDPVGPGAAIEFPAMGLGGHFLVVRDARDVGARTPTNGSPNHTYVLRITELAAMDRVSQTLTVPSSFDDALTEAGGISLYPFTATLNDEIVIDLAAKDLVNPSNMDSRMIIWSADTGDRYALNDDRGLNMDDSLIDTPFFVAGNMVLMVENMDPAATDLRFRLTVTRPQ